MFFFDFWNYLLKVHLAEKVHCVMRKAEAVHVSDRLRLCFWHIRGRNDIFWNSSGPKRLMCFGYGNGAAVFGLVGMHLSGHEEYFRQSSIQHLWSQENRRPLADQGRGQVRNFYFLILIWTKLTLSLEDPDRIWDFDSEVPLCGKLHPKRSQSQGF